MVCERIQTEKMPKLGFGLMRLPRMAERWTWMG